ncbi:MAG: hypothetical protein O7C63_07090 [Alphaproteobacteria bacterium]|nr:hypothetical protein [Alphaproteobacteria bacterium]MCZ6764681.1 hypothetical protein [Alphaproteobacteria bacterium]
MARRVNWGDCDPAGIIYTPRAVDYVVETVEAWYHEVLGTSSAKLNIEEQTGRPTVRFEIDFISALPVDSQIVCELRLERVGRTSLTVQVTAHDGKDKIYFRASMVSCLVEKPAFKPKEFPAEMRERIEAYQAACGDG